MAVIQTYKFSIFLNRGTSAFITDHAMISPARDPPFFQSQVLRRKFNELN